MLGFLQYAFRLLSPYAILRLPRVRMHVHVVLGLSGFVRAMCFVTIIGVDSVPDSGCRRVLMHSR